ncbi:iron chaperone [Staphylococcus simiae]|uniref:YdhG-like domain-containing protein n=1 Tax=Staphylococcus simiae CCM 7213 = CCUG 51256 TaxID=911238 RepID=G5JK09_9STAP|nr:DUF1801 domain-containing protein [Staphylococcus simiae]EHJ07499.1 hypothetical protein SS7213T_09102 [Staphylococcus simiae CCM 7213 = CCUG 51256]PNZ14951.1 iron chaperone [Staphylococcus simiae]SNV84520.1 Uncharacterized conserved protein [Staphylococcus simiae]
MTKAYEAFLSDITQDSYRHKLNVLFQWIEQQFPELQSIIKWNQPIFTHHDTFIIGFSTAKKHFTVSPEPGCLKHFTQRIQDNGYSHTEFVFRIKWHDHIDYDLLRDMIKLNITEKANVTTFWRTSK